MKTKNARIKWIAEHWGYYVEVEKHGRESVIVCGKMTACLWISGSEKSGWRVWADTEINVIAGCSLFEYDLPNGIEYRVARNNDWAKLSYEEIIELLAIN